MAKARPGYCHAEAGSRDGGEQSRGRAPRIRRGSRWNLTREEYRAQAVLFASRGSELPQSKLDDDTVRAIRANLERLTARQWALKLGLHYRTIEKVRQFAGWRHVL